MNKLIVGTLVLLTVSLSSQAQEEVLKSLKTSLISGNIINISPYLSSRTELAFEGDKKIYQKEKAEVVLKSFLTENKPKDFQILHQGASKEGIKYYVGELISSTGTFRVLVYVRTKGDKSLIETLDISKE